MCALKQIDDRIGVGVDGVAQRARGLKLHRHRIFTNWNNLMRLDGQLLTAFYCPHRQRRRGVLDLIAHSLDTSIQVVDRG